MKTSRLATALATTGFFTTFGALSRANAAGKLDFMDPSLIPLVLFFITGFVVYLCNRPRKVVVYARARRRTDAARRME
jgi:hypothetical protein